MPRPRRVSFTSIGLAKGSFPERCQVTAATINGAAYCDTDDLPTVDRLVTDLVQPLLRYGRLCGVLDLKKGVFIPKTPGQDFDPAALVREIEVDAGSDLQTLHNTILDHAQDVLDRDRNGLPWWEVLVVRNTGVAADDDSRTQSAIVVRVHHALGDGIALLHIFRDILTGQEGHDKVTWPASFSTTQSTTTTSFRPKYPWWSFITSTFQVLGLAATKFDTNTAFSRCNHAKMTHNGQRRVCVFPAVSLDFIKALKNATDGATINDVLLATVSQAIYEYCRQAEASSHGNDDDGNDTNSNDSLPKAVPVDAKTRCRVLMPVGFPRPDNPHAPPEDYDMANKWCMVSCDLAVGQADVVQRLTQITHNTTQLKKRPVAFMQLALQNRVVPWLPLALARQTVLDVFSRHSLVLTNVPGPAQPCRLAGTAVIRDFQVFFDNLLTQCSLISYAGRVHGNVIYDPVALPGMQDFGKLYTSALMQLAHALKVEVPKDFAVDE